MSVTWNTDNDMTPEQAQSERARQDAIRWGVRDALLAKPGVTNSELFARFGPSAIKRLNDLKKHHGYDYAREHVGGHVWSYRFTVVPVEPARTPRPGEPGYLASLQPVASINPKVRVAPVVDDAPRPGCLF